MASNYIQWESTFPCFLKCPCISTQPPRRRRLGLRSLHRPVPSPQPGTPVASAVASPNACEPAIEPDSAWFPGTLQGPFVYWEIHPCKCYGPMIIRQDGPEGYVKASSQIPARSWPWKPFLGLSMGLLFHDLPGLSLVFQAITAETRFVHSEIPSGNLTVCYWKWPSGNSGFFHWTWWFQP